MTFRRPEAEDRALFCAYVKEHYAFGETQIEASLFPPGTDYDQWLTMLRQNEKTGSDFGKSLLLACFDADMLVGLLLVKYGLPQALAEIYGHIGYGVRPTQRGKGYATTMLAHGLSVCRGMGMTQVLLGCYKDNAASARVIRKNGGLLLYENDAMEKGHTAQYFRVPL